MLGGMLKDVVILKKSDGQTHENIKAHVQPKLIFIDNAKLPIEEGDHILRELSNGTTEIYLVIARGFYERANGMPAHFQVKVKKTTAI